MQQRAILVVVDDELVRVYIRRILVSRGMNPIEASDGEDALHKVKGFSGALDLLVTDVRMPKMDGIELARAIADLQLHASVLYISGYPFDIEEERNRKPGRVCAFLAKPFAPKALADAVNGCLRPA